MVVGTDWKGLYELLNDLIRQEDVANLETSLSENIDSLIPADLGAPFFNYYENQPHCVRWPDYANNYVDYFNSYYGKICPVPFNVNSLLLGPVSWKHHRHTEYDTDFNRPLNIGHTFACGFRNPRDNSIHVIALTRSRRCKPFSHKDTYNFRLLATLFANLYYKIDTSISDLQRGIRHVNMLRGIIPLSCREAEICTLICKHYTSREIAELLSISSRTVECHCMHIYNKMNVKNRNELLNLIFTAVS